MPAHLQKSDRSFSASLVEEPEEQPQVAADPTRWNQYDRYEEPTRSRRNRARMWNWIAVIVALLMVSAIAALTFVDRDRIAGLVGTQPAGGGGLHFTRRDVTREPLPTDKDLITITGEITNQSEQVQRVPQIRVVVLDAEQRVTYRWTIAAPVTELQAGQAVTFSGASTDVPRGSKRIELDFGPVT